MKRTGDNYIHSELTEKIIRCVYDVFAELGAGFLEKVYGNALNVQLREIGLSVVRQAPVAVFYRGVCVGEYFADLMVEDTVIIELKALSELSKVHEVQLVNYLKQLAKKLDCSSISAIRSKSSAE